MNEKLNNDSIGNQLQEYLTELMASDDRIQIVTISTADGKKMASKSRFEISASKIAAMSSSLVALATTFVKEVDQGSCKYALVEGEQGYCLAFKVSNSIILSAIATQGMPIGLLLLASKQCVEKILKLRQGLQEKRPALNTMQESPSTSEELFNAENISNLD